MSPALWPRLRPAVPALALAALLLGLLFHAEIAAAVGVWNRSTAYGHCWLIVPIAAFLAWERRWEAASSAMAPQARLAWLAVPFALIWLVADLLGIMEGRQLALIGFGEVAVLAVFGVRLFQSLSAALLYVVFLVPFGAFITPALQRFTSGFIERGLNLFGIVNQVSGNVIEIPEGVFYVAEACAGLRFLIASIAFGVLYALTMFVSPWRRVAFVAVACIVPVFANGVRALGIVILGHFLGSAQAAATDHLLYGWIFFSMVIAALALLGMPFRQAPPPPPPPGPLPAAGLRMSALYAVWPVLLLAALGPAVALAWTARDAKAPAGGIAWTTPPGCTSQAPYAQGGMAAQDFVCGHTRLVARAAVLPRRSNPSRVVALAQAQAAELLPGADTEDDTLTAQGLTWQVQRDERTDRAAATLLVVDGVPATGGLRDRMRLARDLFTGAGPSPVVLAVAVTQGNGDPLVALRAFLEAQGRRKFVLF